MKAFGPTLERTLFAFALVLLLGAAGAATALPRGIGHIPFDPNGLPTLEPFDPPPAPSVAELQGRGFVCRPHLGQTRCDGSFVEPIARETSLTVYLCNHPSSCQVRARKYHPAKIPGDQFGLWSFRFPFGAKASGVVDVDADGDADVIGFLGTSVSVARSNGVNELSQSPEVWATGFCGSLSQECAVGDVSGDDRADVLSFDKSTGVVSVAVSNGSAFVDARTWHATLGTAAQRFLVGDFDGDGFDDLGVILKAGTGLGATGAVLVALNRPGPAVIIRGGSFLAGAILPPIFGGGGPRVFKAPTQWIGAVCPTPAECQVGDFNGDGRDDLARVRATGEAFVALSTGTAFLPEVEWSFRLGRNPLHFRVVDANSDGKDDLVTIRGDGGVTYGISDGSSFSGIVDQDEQFCADGPACTFGDVNADGHPDLVEIARFANSDQQNGDTFVSLGGDIRGFPEAPERPALADQDGDGVADAADNCVTQSNASQADADRDGLGDACELQSDVNGDGIVNFADLAFLKSRFLTANAAADVNRDGTVNFLDLAMVKSEFLKPPALSAAKAPPVLEVRTPIHGDLYDPGTRAVFVDGFVRNVAPVDARVRVRSPGSVLELPVAADGYFRGFVPIDSQSILNAVAVDLERRSTGEKTTERLVSMLGRSVAAGDFSNAVVAGRVSDWQLEEIVDFFTARISPEALEASAVGGSVLSANIPTGPTMDVRLFSDQLVADLAIPRIDAEYEDFQTGCNVRVFMTGITARLTYDLEPDRNPFRIEVKEAAGSPNVQFSGFDWDANAVCKTLASVFENVEARAREAVVGALRAGDFADGPVDGRLEDAINGVNLSGVLSFLGVTLQTRFDAVTEDILGITLGLDAAIVPSAECPAQLCVPPPGSSAKRIFQIVTPHPPFPLFAPGGDLYDVAVALAPDSFNQLFDAVTRSGALATYFRDNAEVDLSTSQAAFFIPPQLQKRLRLVPTMAPVATGRAGTEGSLTEIQMGQILVEIPTVDGQDAFRIAIDARGSLDFELIASGGSGPLDTLQVRVHGIEVLRHETLRIPPGVVAGFESFAVSQLLPGIESQDIAFEFPLPAFEGFDLELFQIDKRSDGGALVYGLLGLE